MAGSSKPTPDKDFPQKDGRNERLAAALRENLKRRKAQARSQQEKIKSPPEEKTGG
jgi:hypothetical protein